MDIEKLIERLQNAAGGPEGIEMCQDAATALSTLKAENKSLRVLVELGNTRAKDYRVMRDRAVKAEAENENLRAELERMKRIMRDNGIMTIPSKYLGGPTEWNIPKPRGQKED